MKQTFHIHIDRTHGAPIDIGGLTRADVNSWTESWYAAASWLTLHVTPEPMAMAPVKREPKATPPAQPPAQEAVSV